MFISKKGLLEWKTFGQNEKSSSSSFYGYYKRFFPNVLSGLVLLFCKKIFFSILGIYWILTPFILYLMSRKQKEEKGITDEEKKTLTEYSEKIWRFFSENVDARTNYLPPDNIQTAPTDAVAYRTSPTNIGFYLLSCLAAVDFGFITKDECERRLKNSFSVIESLDKYHGHLYNWYELKHLNILGDKFVSTVDSGNFITMLVALKEGLSELGLTDLSIRAEKLIKEADFSVFYNKKKKLFTIGINGETEKAEENCYDLFMSEARTNSYFATATCQVPQKHWKNLGRTLISEKGFLGMASWSGTMFEYFMPVLFLPLYKNSFSYEALAFAFNVQKRGKLCLFRKQISALTPHLDI
jgi:cyclic beta-1,2-glucan synthetase